MMTYVVLLEHYVRIANVFCYQLFIVI